MITSQNQIWGFYGTLQSATGWQDAAVERVYSATARTIIDACQVTEQQAIKFLDSRMGRHLADEIGATATLPRWVTPRFVATWSAY